MVVNKNAFESRGINLLLAAPTYRRKEWFLLPFSFYRQEDNGIVGASSFEVFG